MSHHFNIIPSKQFYTNTSYFVNILCTYVLTGRVICAILGLNAEEQLSVMEGISRLTPAVVATTAAQSLATSVYSLFA